MVSIADTIYKEKTLVEAYEYTFNKKTRVMEEHFEVIVDEKTEGRTNQQKFWLDAEKTAVAEKLDNLDRYSEVALIINVDFYEGKPSKIRILDVITDETEKQQLKDIYCRY